MKLIEVFKTRCKCLEIIFLLDDVKPVVRQGFYDDELKKVEKFCEKEKLFLIKSKFKVMPIEQGYSNKGYLSTDGMTFVYISKDELLANKAAYFELTLDHFKLGQTLGYPKCCSLFFSKEFPIRSKLDNNYEEPLIKNSIGEKFPFQNNIFKRNEDYAIISHFPCNLNCKESIKIADKFLEIMRIHFPKFSEEIENMLKKKVNNLVFY